MQFLCPRSVNFKKNEKTYNPANSAVFKMVQDLDRQPKEPEPGIDIDPAEATSSQKGLSSRSIQSRSFRMLQSAVDDGAREYLYFLSLLTRFSSTISNIIIIRLVFNDPIKSPNWRLYMLALTNTLKNLFLIALKVFGV